MTEICPIDICTGCQACRLVCPTKAIRFEENERGHIYPVIDAVRCIDCKKCKNTCPSINGVRYNDVADTAIACWLKDDKRRMKSTSGGLSFGLSEAFVKKGEYFVGVEWDPVNNIAKHTITNKISELPKYQGSKYSHSDVGNVYADIKNLLNDGHRVLFSGTPCQIAGLKAFLHKEYESLYTVGLVCHGVPSRKALRERISEIENKSGAKVIDYLSRVKTPDQYLSSSQYTLDNGQKKQISIFQDYFYRLFVTNYGLRPNCFNCQYALSTRVEDITISDFWGYSPLSLKYRDYKRGTSLVLLNNVKGKELFDSINDNLCIDYRPISSAQCNNRNLVGPQKKPERYEDFWTAYLSGKSLEELCPEYYPLVEYKESKISVLKRYIKMIIPNNLLKFITQSSRHS